MDSFIVRTPAPFIHPHMTHIEWLMRSVANFVLDDTEVDAGAFRKWMGDHVEPNNNRHGFVSAEDVWLRFCYDNKVICKKSTIEALCRESARIVFRKEWKAVLNCTCGKRWSHTHTFRWKRTNSAFPSRCVLKENIQKSANPSQ